MDRADITELHYISHVDNVPSIMSQGILSRYWVGQNGVESVSLADADIVARRADRSIPGSYRLDQYANLFFNARNAMLFRLTCSTLSRNLAVLRIRSAVLDLPGVVVTEINAAAGSEPLWHGPGEGLTRLDRDVVFAESWQDSDEVKRRMMAEVLVPGGVPASYLFGAYMVSDWAARQVPWARMLPVTVNRYLFFVGDAE